MQRRQQQQLGAAHNRVRHAAAGFADRRGQLGEEIPVQALGAMHEQIAEDEDQRSGGEQRAQSRQG